MAQIIGLPKLSPTMEEGVLVRWTKHEGDKVSPGDLVAEVETDKANMDFNIEDEGVLLKLLVKEGDTVKLGAPVAIIGRAGEDIGALIEEAKGAAEVSGFGLRASGPETSTTAPAAKAEPREATRPEMEQQRAKATTKPPAPASTATGPAPKPDGGRRAPEAAPGKLLASPLAKTLAIELGIDLRNVQGTGPGGRIVERDVRAATQVAPRGNGHRPEARSPKPEAAPEAAEQPTALAVRHARQMVPDTDADYTDLPASSMRKRIAARLTEAKRDVPHFYLMRQFDAAPMLGFRERLNALLGDRGRVSVNDLIVKAVALALRRVPECNAAWEPEATSAGGEAAIRVFHRVHVGVAVAIEDGLVTPVIRDADQKGIGAIAAEVRDLAERAKHRQLKGPEITGSTFTVSNLGMYGIERFTAILNPPEAGILAIGGVIDTPVVEDGQVVAGKRMTVTMSCDHRVIDGALGARWLAAFVDLIEHPEALAL